MHRNDPEESRVETITAALVYLMTHYARTGCPRLAVCVSRHLQAVALHPDAAPVLRDIVTDFEVHPTMDRRFIYTILGGRIDPSALSTAVISSDGSVRLK